jgi:PAS domain S-box-containing protein
MWVTSKPLSEKDAAKALAKVLPNLDSYVKKRQIEIIPHDKWYVKNSVFNSKKVSKGLLNKLNKALAEGYDGLRLTGNTFWLEKKDWNSFMNHEKEVDSVIGEHNIIVLCTYSLNKCGANEVIDVAQNHQFVLIKREGKWEIIESSERKRAEDEIKRFASFPQLNPNPVLEIDSSGTIVFCNAATVQALRKLNLRDTTLFLPNDLSDILDALEQEKDVQFYREVKIKDRIFGEVLYLTPQFDSIRIYANDITERKAYQEALKNALQQSRQHEEELRSERQKLINILDSMEDGVYIVNQQYDIEYVNPLLEREYGHVNGRKCHEYFEDQEKACSWCKNQEVFTGKTIRWEWYSSKTNKTYDLINTPLRNPDGSVSKLGIFRDITERKQAEEVIRESREDLNRAQVVAHTGSWRLDVRKNELLWSDENHRIFGIPKGTPMTYETFLGTVHPDDREYVNRKWMAALQGEHYEIEHRIVVQGNIRWVRERAELEFDQDGSLQGGFGTTQDITERKKAEEALRKSEARYRSYLEVTGQVGWTTDANGLVVEDMPTWRQYTGQSREEIQAWGWSKVLHPDDLERTSEIWRKAVREKRKYETEYRLRRPDGAYRHFLARGVPTFNEDGSIREWVGTCIDITERKHMEEELRRSHDELEIRVQERTAELKEAQGRMKATNDLLSLFVTKFTKKEYLDSVVDLIHEWTDCKCIGIRILDKQGNIPYESYTGFSLEFWEAENWISVKNHQCACIRVVLQKPDPQDVNMMTANGSFYCNNTETFAGMLPEQELSRYRGLCIRSGFKSVAIIPIRYKNSVIGAIHIADKREAMVPMEKIEFIESLTPLMGEAIFRFSAEEALSESEERYRMLIEAMNEGLGMDDENGLLVYANDRLCEMLGYSLDEIIGRPVLSFFDDKNQKIIQEQIEKRKSGENESYRLEWTKKDGQKIITLVSPKGIFNSAGKYKGSFAVITDITEKLRLESIAEAVNTMDNIGFIFSGVRHEIGNPVNSIKIALSVLKQNLDSYSKEMIREYADRMLSEIQRMEYLLKAMKSFNLFETVELIDVNMTTFMDNFLRLISDDFAKKGIRIETNIRGTLWAYIDPRALHQVLLNVMTNASDAFKGRENATITIRSAKLGDMINITVEDNGCGMTEQQQEDLFKPFYTTKSKGTGLGLVIAKKMMTKMKGFIEVVSEKGKGTIVDLFVPEGISE